MEQQFALPQKAASSTQITAESGEPADGVHELAAGQLGWVSAGAQRVQTRAGTFVTSPAYAVWIPGRTAHDTAKCGSGRYYRVSFWGSINQVLPSRCCTIQLSPRLHEAVLQAERVRALHAAHPVCDVFREEICDAGVRPIQISIDRPARLAPLMASLLEEPGDPRSLEEWAAELRMSPRTLTRTFQREIGMSYRDWRRQAQLMRALERLAQGEPVSKVARQVGFRSVSMFIQMFRCTLGTTPGRYYDRRA